MTKAMQKQKIFYPHKYKYGKQKAILPLPAFQAAIQDSVNKGALLHHIAFCIGLWHTGVRKSELYDRQLDDVTITENFVIIDFGLDFGFYKGHRKKRGAKVPPLKIPRGFYGVEEFLIPHIQMIERAHKRTKKRIRYQADTGKTTERHYRFRTGHEVVKVVPLLEWREEWIRAIWLFPRIGSTMGWKIVKRVFGETYYPHYLRLRKLSKIGGNPKTNSIVHIKSFSGLRSIAAIQAYMGVDENLQNEAMIENE